MMANRENDTDIRYALSGESLAEAGAFLDSYRGLRRAEMRGSDDPEFYLRLPDGDFSGARASEWRMRKESLEWLTDYLTGPRGGRTLKILDAGAGNCWMTRRLAEQGYDVTALDLNDDDYDGLGAGRHYLERLPVRFERVAADFADLPFAAATFDMVIYNGSIHYARNPRGVIAEGARVLKKGGEIVLIDSPFYRDAKSGEKMLAERSDPGRARYLTYDELERIADRLGLGLRFYFRPISFPRRVRRRLLELRLGRETASMPWVVLRKK